MLQTSQDLYDQQMQMRQDDTRDAAWTLISCLVLALLLGGLAAVLITRQIVPPCAKRWPGCGALPRVTSASSPRLAQRRNRQLQDGST